MEGHKRKIIIGGNWKCNGDLSFIKSFSSEIDSFKISNEDNSNAEVILFPPFIHLSLLKEKHPHLKLGSQTISQYGNGAFTGVISPQLLKDIGITTTLIGHSESRSLFGDSEEVISAKLKNAEANLFEIVMCVGEVLSERENQQTVQVLKRQLETIKSSIKNWDKVIIAYEPVWAIGTGKTASPEEAEETILEIRNWIKENVSEEVSSKISIIYGGSVNGSNCEKLISQKNIDGFLVGGASLKSEFKKIVDSYKVKN
jgi:triosephosphate isomerase